MKTYQDRVNELQTVEDVSEQIRKTKAAMMHARTRSKQPATLAEKLKWKDAEKHHAQVLRNLRVNVFDLEDAIKAEQDCTLANAHLGLSAQVEANSRAIENWKAAGVKRPGTPTANAD